MTELYIDGFLLLQGIANRREDVYYCGQNTVYSFRRCKKEEEHALSKNSGGGFVMG